MEVQMNQSQKKSKRAIIFICVIAAGIFLYCLFDVVKGFHPQDRLYDHTVSSGTFVKGEGGYCAGPVYKLKHTINGVIPTANEYFYVVFNETLTDYVVVKAPKNWKYANYGDEMPEIFQIEGKVRTFGYTEAKDINQILTSEIEGGIYLDHYIDTTSQRTAIIFDICLVVFVTLLILLIQMTKGIVTFGEKSAIVSKTILILIAILCFVLIHYLNLIM